MGRPFRGRQSIRRIHPGHEDGVRTRLRLAVLAAFLCPGAAPAAAVDDPPSDATTLIEQSQKEVDAIQAKADKEIEARNAKLLRELKALRDSLTKAGKYDEALAVHEQIRARQLPRRVEVEWNGAWYAAEILRIDGGKSYIRYTGYDDTRDEWVTKDRVRPPTGRAIPPPAAVPAGGVAPVPAQPTGFR